ncbi:MAG: reverse transcriptase family protein [Candidatus Magasanikbacteria bacterium]
MKKKRKFKFYSTKFLAEYLGVSEDFFIDLIQQRPKYFTCLTQKDKKGKERTFYKAWGPFKKILAQIDRRILNRISYHNNFMGGISGRNLKQNAEQHLGNKNIFKIDIKSFYPSITPTMVRKALLSLGMSQACATSITSLATADEHLPQGFSTSPKLAALVLYPVDSRLHNLAQKNGWVYTFWIDDITISANTPIAPFKKIIFKIIEDSGFKINQEKTSLANKCTQMLVTGIVINKKINIPLQRRREIRQILYCIREFGPKNYLAREKSKEQIRTVKKLKEEIIGKIRYALSINPNLGRKLMKEFRQIDWTK